MNSNFVQVVILLCSAAACVLHSFTQHSAKRWAFRASLVAQPFWFYTASKNGQWGIMLLSFLFAFMATRGLRNHREKGI